MSESRIPCPVCGASILPVTAKHNDGMCAPCGLNKRVAEREKAETEARRNAPPPPINYGRFTESEFVQGLSRILGKHADDPSAVCREFLGFCDPILLKQPMTLLGTLLDNRRRLFPKLKRIPRPFRELMAAYQAWGMVSSDGFEIYCEMTSPKFDSEVDRGVRLLGYSDVAGVIAEARVIYNEHGEDIPKEMDEDLWKRFYDALPDFESQILGPELLRRI